MRVNSILILSLIVIVSTAFADEKLPVLKVGSETYSNVTVTQVTATDIYFIYDKGAANVRLANLDPALQKHFNYAPATAEDQNKQTNNAESFLHIFHAGHATDISDVKAKMDAAIARVNGIVNQPVKSLPRTPDMQVSTYSPGWFHAGASRPDFNTVDVRKTQQLDYIKNQYVTSDLNPGVVFLGSELEFNSMTKYFYQDRSVPKKRLTEDEMLEINSLYRVIGKCQAQMDAIQNPPSVLETFTLWAKSHKPIVLGIVGVLFVALIVLRTR